MSNASAKIQKSWGKNMLTKRKLQVKSHDFVKLTPTEGLERRLCNQTTRNDFRDDWCGVRPEGVWWSLFECSKGRRCGCQSGGNISEKRELKKIETQIKTKKMGRVVSTYERNSFNLIFDARDTWRGLNAPWACVQVWFSICNEELQQR